MVWRYACRRNVLSYVVYDYRRGLVSVLYAFGDLQDLLLSVYKSVSIQARREEVLTMAERVNHPAHYNAGGIECNGNAGGKHYRLYSVRQGKRGNTRTPSRGNGLAGSEDT